jgi:hypothetical protein
VFKLGLVDSRNFPQEPKKAQAPATKAAMDMPMQISAVSTCAKLSLVALNAALLPAPQISSEPSQPIMAGMEGGAGLAYLSRAAVADCLVRNVSGGETVQSNLPISRSQLQ